MALVETIGLLAALAALIYWYFTKDNNYWTKRGVPHEKPTFLFGNMFDAITGKRNVGQVIEDLYKAHKGKKVVGIFQFTKPSLMVCDPAMVSRMLTSDFHRFAYNDMEVDEKLDPVMASNIFLQRGEKWKRNRQALSPAYTVNRIKATFDKIQNVADKLINYLEQHPEDEVKQTMSLYTSEIVASWGIGIDGHSFDSNDAILPKLGKMMFNPTFMMNLSFTVMFLCPSLAHILRLKFVPDEIPNFFNGVVSDLIEAREKSDVPHKDFLEYFLDLKKRRAISKNDDQNDVTSKDIMNGLVSFFVEGYETSSVILSFLLYHLTLDEDLQKRLRSDIDEMYKNGATPSYDAISQLPLLNQIYSETVRLYGAISLAKVCSETCDLDLGNGQSLRVEEGTSIVIPLRGLQTDPEYWPNPDKFDPSRFADDFVPIKGTYIPFGDGPRICIGMRIASAIIKTAVVNIIRHYYLLRTKKTSPVFVQDPNHFMTLMKGGIHVKFSKRTSYA